MRICFFFLSVWLISQTTLAQKTDANYNPPQYKSTTCNSSFEFVANEPLDNADKVQKYLAKTLINLRDERSSIKLNYTRQSPGGFHYSFTQLFNGLPIYQSEIKVNTDRNGAIHSLFDNSFNTLNWNLAIGNTSESSIIYVNIENNEPFIALIGIEDRFKETIRVNGAMVFQRDVNSYNQPPDSLITGLVFNPDPLTTSHHIYADSGIYIDNNDANIPCLQAQEKLVAFRVAYENDTFKLKSQFVKVSDFDLPVAPPATSTAPQFYFDRSQTGFEDVNAFYHLSTIRNYVSSLGFDCADSLIEIDTHAVNGDDNSFFSPIDQPHRIYYGTGGVDDAEDADVCVHEYGHSLSYTAAPGSNIGSQRSALDEAFGDYLAASYSKSLNAYNDDSVFNWDGCNQYWNGRIVNSAKIYPTDLQGSIYRNGEIWSAVLFSLNGDIGRGITDSLILQTHYSYAANISMVDAAQLLLDADALLFNKAYHCPISARLREHGFIPNNPNDPCSLASIEDITPAALHFIQNGSQFTLLNDHTEKLKLNIINISGQRVAAIDENQNTYIYQNLNLPAGIYLVNVVGEHSSATFKWIKVK